MDSNYKNISKIETFFNRLIDNVVSHNTFASSLPMDIDSAWKDMVVIDCASALEDYGGYSSGIVNILLYTKPTSAGAKNVTLMSSLEAKLNDVINSSVDEHYKISVRDRNADYDETKNLHVVVVRIDLVII